MNRIGWLTNREAATAHDMDGMGALGVDAKLKVPKEIRAAAGSVPELTSILGRAETTARAALVIGVVLTTLFGVVWLGSKFFGGERRKK